MKNVINQIDYLWVLESTRNPPKEDECEIPGHQPPGNERIAVSVTSLFLWRWIVRVEENIVRGMRDVFTKCIRAGLLVADLHAGTIMSGKAC